MSRENYRRIASWLRKMGEAALPDCELLDKCPFYKDATGDVSEMTKIDKERYCKRDYAWCGRYMTIKALPKEKERQYFFRPYFENNG